MYSFRISKIQHSINSLSIFYAIHKFINIDLFNIENPLERVEHTFSKQKLTKAGILYTFMHLSLLFVRNCVQIYRERWQSYKNNLDTFFFIKNTYTIVSSRDSFQDHYISQKNIHDIRYTRYSKVTCVKIAFFTKHCCSRISLVAATSVAAQFMRYRLRAQMLPVAENCQSCHYGWKKKKTRENGIVSSVSFHWNRSVRK